MTTARSRYERHYDQGREAWIGLMLPLLLLKSSSVESPPTRRSSPANGCSWRS